MSARITNHIATGLFWFSGILVFGLLVAMLGYIFWKGLPVLTLDFLFGMPKGLAPPFFSFSSLRKKRTAAPGEEKEREAF